MKRNIITACLTVMALAGYGFNMKNVHSVHHKNNDHSAHHHNHRHKVAAAPGLVYLSGKDSFAPGLHLKYAYGFHAGSLHASIGLVGDIIFTDHPHYGVGLSVGVEPFDRFHLHFGPMLAFDHGETVLNASVGIAYPFKLNGLAIGPVTEISFNSKDYHWMTGVVFMFVL